jgi:lysyl-tRNA synthetase class II
MSALYGGESPGWSLTANETAKTVTVRSWEPGQARLPSTMVTLRRQSGWIWMKHRYRSHTCGELRAADVDSDVRLSGWLHNRRDLGGVIFVDLRDNSGLVQLVVRSDSAAYEPLSSLPKETVLRANGRVLRRSRERQPGSADG